MSKVVFLPEQEEIILIETVRKIPILLYSRHIQRYRSESMRFGKKLA